LLNINYVNSGSLCAIHHDVGNAVVRTHSIVGDIIRSSSKH